MSGGAVRVSLVTPVFNGEASIGDTLRSIDGQTAVAAGRVELEHIVVDGRSGDGTLRILEHHAKPWRRVVSESDSGMYDALAKGFRMASGDLVGYVNSGDLLLPSALETVAGVARDVPSVRWFTGIHLLLGESGAVTDVAPPWRFRRDLLRAGAYGPLLPFVQQESTFWRRELLEAVDLDRLATFRLAGDHFLWWSFAAVAELDVVWSAMAGFAIQPGQLSEDRAGYFREMASVSGALGLRDRLAAWVERKRGWWGSPDRRLRTNPHIVRYDHAARRWRRAVD